MPMTGTCRQVARQSSEVVRARPRDCSGETSSQEPLYLPVQLRILALSAILFVEDIFSS
jgi:hypothetical protein